MSSRWPDVPLGEVVENCNARRVPIKSADREKRAGGYPYYGASGIIDTIDDYLFDGEHLLIGEDGANLIARSTPIAFRAHGKFWVNNHAHVVRFNGKADLRFLEHYFTTLDLTPYVTGSAQPKLTRENLDRIPVPLPPLPEQRRIADILDKADAIRRKRKEAIALTEELLRSAFLEMFGDPVSNEKGWPLTPADHAISRFEAGWSANGEARSRNSDEFGVLKISAVTSGYFRAEEHKAVSQVDIDRELITPRRGDLLFSRANTRELVAACCLVEKDEPRLFLPDKLWRLIPDETLTTTAYLRFLLSHEGFRNELTKRATGTSGSMLNISMEKVRSMVLPTPPRSLQKRFTAFVWKIYDLRAKQLEHNTIDDHLFSSLVDRAFRGELTSPSTPSSPKRKQLGLFGD